MPDKFKRYIKLTVEAVTGELVEIGDPYTIEFNVVRNRFTSANNASITIYNLGNESRKKIYKDSYNTNVYRFFELRAGYGEPLGGGFTNPFTTPLLSTIVSDSEKLTPVIFQGDILQCYSERRGVDMLTHIITYDGGFALGNSEANIAIGKNIAFRQVIRSLMLAMPGISVGAIGNFEGYTKRSNSFLGSPSAVLSQITNNNFHIDLEKAYALKTSEYLIGVIPKINVKSGLLGTPIRYENKIDLTMLFEPNIVLDQLVDLESITAENLNGRFKVVGINHSGMVSPVVNGNGYTKLTLYDRNGYVGVERDAT